MACGQVNEELLTTFGVSCMSELAEIFPDALTATYHTGTVVHPEQVFHDNWRKDLIKLHRRSICPLICPIIRCI